MMTGRHEAPLPGLTCKCVRILQLLLGHDKLGSVYRLLTLLFIITCLASEADALKGTCFSKRLDNGNCIHIIMGIHSHQSCCQHSGYYLYRTLSRWEYLRDHLILENGTPNCAQSCELQIEKTCEKFYCARGHICQLVNHIPTCICNVSCAASDHFSGIQCTRDFLVFSNKCMLKKAVCRAPHLESESIPCTNNISTCVKEFPAERREYLTGAATAPQIAVETAGQGKNADWPYVTNLSLNEAEYFRFVCPEGEFCMHRQWNGMASCMRRLSVPRNDWRQYRGPLGHVCGVDNRTYANRYKLRHAGLQNKMEIRIAYAGDCKAGMNCTNVPCQRHSMACRPHHQTGQPVCLDCSELPRDCNPVPRTSWHHDRESAKPESSQLEGDPMWEGHVDTANWPLVCGTNRKIYANACFLHVVNCLGDKFVGLSPIEHCIDVD